MSLAPTQTTTQTTTQATIPAARTGRRQHPVRTRVAALGVAFAAAASLAVAGSESASADVNSGAGGSASTYAQCSQSHTMHRATQISYVNAERSGQTVAVQVALYDANGWHYSSWSTTNGSARFSTEWTGLSGYSATVYARYGWYESNGWKTSGWDQAHYSSIYGGATNGCAI